jgi:hypothetical protein
VTSQNTRAAAEREELLSVCPDQEAAGEVLDALIDARLLTSYEISDTERPVSESHSERGVPGAPFSHSEGGIVEHRAKNLADVQPGPASALASTPHRIEIAHESLLKAWPRLVRWQMQDEEGAQLRDQLKQAANLWEEKGRSADLLWTGTAYQEYELWRQRYAGSLTAAEDRFTHAMVEHVSWARRRRRLVVGGAFVALLIVLGLVGLSRQQAVTARQEAVAESRRAESGKLLALGQLELDTYPTAALAYTAKSLELADTPENRRFAVEALQRGPTATIMPAWQEDGLEALAPGGVQPGRGVVCRGWLPASSSAVPGRSRSLDPQ